MHYAPRVTRQARHSRDEIVTAAVELLEEHGPGEMSVRKITAKLGSSRIAVYTAFDSMSGLVAGVVDHGFALLLKELQHDDTASGLAAICHLSVTTRRFALAHRHLYGVMFAAESFAGYERTGPELEQGTDTLRVLHRACVQAYEAGELPAERPPLSAARQVWSAVHGHVMLELAGYLAAGAPTDEAFADTVSTVLIGLGARKADVAAAIADQASHI